MLASGRVEAVLQPIVEMSTGATVAVEAFARPPGAAARMDVEGMFIAAQRMGRSGELDRLCRRAALAAATTVDLHVPLHINVGVALLVEGDNGLAAVLSEIAWAGFQPDQVVLELAGLRRPSRFAELLAAYRRAGLRLGLDDVGRGATTIESLVAVAPDVLKLSPRLASAARRSAVGRASLEGIVVAADARGTRVVAEQVESAEDRDLLLASGVRLGQGYFFAAPARPVGRTRALGGVA